MASRILNGWEIAGLEPTVELAAQTASQQGRFTATSPEEARRWQAETRRALAGALGFLEGLDLDSGRIEPSVPLNEEVIEEVDRGDFIRRKVVISTAPLARMPVYLLIPKTKSGERPAGRRPVAIAHCGHGYGVKAIVGLSEKGEEQEGAEGYHKDFALALCRRGFLVAAPEPAAFGERRIDYGYLDRDLGQHAPTSCHHAAMWAQMLGGSLLGMRVRDSLRLVDYLAGLAGSGGSGLDRETAAANPAPLRLATMGISGGGTLTFFHAALDPRVRACVVSGYLSGFRESILAMDHCSCNYAPGLLRLGEMADLAGLILPRPLLVEAGTRDPIFPIDGVRRTVARAREICATLGGDPARDVELDEFEGGHVISGRRAYDFLWERVRP